MSSFMKSGVYINNYIDPVEIPINDEFSLTQIFECGQCFRWKKLGDEHYSCIAQGYETEFSFRNGVLKAYCTEDIFDKFWKNYLDIDRDYAAIRRQVSIDEQTKKCVEYGAGIRILQQDPWEALCSFIISQCNNIPRIQGIIDKLCRGYGDKIGPNSFSFPAPSVLSKLEVHELDFLRSGYRAPYIISAANAVESGEIDFDMLRDADTDTALKKLMTLPGVGIKVASCMVLFGLHKLDAFPIDTWMKKAIASLYGAGFDPRKAFGEYAGIAQQYIFYHTRETSRNKK